MRLLKFIACFLAITSFHCLAETNEAIKVITANLHKIQPNIKIEEIKSLPIANLWQVELTGGRQLYVSTDGKYLIQGNLYQFEQDTLVNLTQQAEQKGIAKTIGNIPTTKMIIFAPEKSKAYVTIFTDTTCGYCQKLHSEINQINNLGIEVRYLAFPRGGQASEGFQELTNVWCAKDKLGAMTHAKNRQRVEKANLLCHPPVMEHYEIGNMIGVTGTPAIILEDGTLIPGYLPAKDLAQAALDHKKK